jgi:predicted dehydrogenase
MINFGVIGTSWITEEFIKCASFDENFKLNAVYSRSEEKVKAFAEKYNVTNVFTDLEEMAKSQVIQAVYIASPNGLHASQSILFLNNKKHVLCEKPMALTLQECTSMIKASERTGKKLMVGQVCRYAPGFTSAKQLIDDGQIGELFLVESEYAHDYTHSTGVGNWRLDPVNSDAVRKIGEVAHNNVVDRFSQRRHVEHTIRLMRQEFHLDGNIQRGAEAPCN